MTPNFMMKTNFTPLEKKKETTVLLVCFFQLHVSRISSDQTRGKRRGKPWSHLISDQRDEISFAAALWSLQLKEDLQIGFNLPACIFMTKNVPTIIREITLFYHHAEIRVAVLARPKTRSKREITFQTLRHKTFKKTRSILDRFWGSLSCQSVLYNVDNFFFMLVIDPAHA